MSVNLLSNPSSPVETSDELESFFHVLLYYCIRYLRSNCPCPTSYIENYFETYSGPGGFYTCGWKSFTMADDEFLSCQYPPCRLLFHSPMDELIDVIRKCFQSLYKVRQDDARKSIPQPPRRNLPSLRPPGKSPFPIRKPVVRYFGSDGKRPAYVPPPPPRDKGPTSEDRERAKKVMDHKFVIEQITRALSSSEWPDDDRAPVPAVETKTSGSESISLYRLARRTIVGNKRRRITTPERNVSLPPRLHASTRRTRLTPHTLPVWVRS